MRIKQLILHAFGQFTEKQLEIGDRPATGSDFHIFYGANEAGKTTIMEAWLRFLFGILPRETYDFLHKRQDLKISTTLQMQGEELNLTRIPRGHGSVLLDEQNQTIGEQILASAMREMSNADEYRNMLCLDDKSLEEGGDAIIRSKGQVGELLFSAGSGLSGFSKMLENYAEKTDAIYKSSGKSTEFAVKLREHNEVSEELEKLSLTPDNYEQMKQRLRNSAENEKKLKKQSDDLYKKLGILHDARRYYETEAKLSEKIAEQIAQMQKAASELGAEVSGSDDASAVYATLRPFAVNAAELQKMRDILADLSALERQISEQKQENELLSEKLRQAQRNCAALENALPPKEQRRNLATLLRDMAADDLKQNYLIAESGKKRLDEQMRQALLDLSFKGQNFDAVPPSSLSAREAADKLKQISKMDVDLSEQNKMAIAREAEMERIEANLAALRDNQGRRIMPADAAQNFEERR